MPYTANTLRRFFAYILDSLILWFFAFIPLSIDFGRWLFGEPIEISWPRLSLLFLIPLVFRVGFLMSMGATPGKWLLGLRVVDATSGRKLRLDQAVIRSLSEFLSFFFSYTPQVVAFFRADRRQLADLLAQTRVIQYDAHYIRPVARPVFATFAVVIALSSATQSLISKASYLEISPSGIFISGPTWFDI